MYNCVRFSIDLLPMTFEIDALLSLIKASTFQLWVVFYTLLKPRTLRLRSECFLIANLLFREGHNKCVSIMVLKIFVSHYLLN